MAKTREITDSDRVACLIRIYRAARIAKDLLLARDTATELRRYGIEVAEKAEVANA